LALEHEMALPGIVILTLLQQF